MATGAQIEAVLKQIIADEREASLEDLANGAPEDYAGYREIVGYIRALDNFTDWWVEAMKRFDER